MDSGSGRKQSRTSPEEILKADMRKLQASISDTDRSLEIETLENASSAISTFLKVKLGNDSTSSDSSKNDGDCSRSPNSYPSTKELLDVWKDDVPKWFLCPISSEVMRNPVVVETGETYDLDYIHKWIEDGNLTCPMTQKVLMEISLVPNLLVQRLISHWKAHKNFDLPPPPQMGKPTDSVRLEVHKLFDKITSSDTKLSEKRKAAVDLREFTTNSISYRRHLVEIPNSITILLTLSSDDTVPGDPELKQEVTLIVSALCNDTENRDLFCQSDQRMLVEIIKKGQTMLTRASAAAAIFFLLTIEDNRRRILDMGVLIPIMNLFAMGDANTKEITCSILFTLCTSFPEAVETLVELSARVTIQSLMSAIRDSKMRKQALAILALMSRHQKSAAEIIGIFGVGWILDIVCRRRENCDCLKNAMAVLHRLVMSTDDVRVWTAVENCSGHLFVMSESGIEIVRVLAEEILARLSWARKGKGVVIA